MRINNNVTAMNTHRQLNLNNISAGKSVEKLSSGFRINRAADDAAGLTISEKMRAQIKGLNRASMNAQDGVSMIQSAESSLSEFSAILIRVRELAIQGANEAMNSGEGADPDDDLSGEYSAIQSEISSLGSELSRIINVTQFNGKTLFNGSIAIDPDTPAGYFHVGSNSANDPADVSDLANPSNIILLPETMDMITGLGDLNLTNDGTDLAELGILDASNAEACQNLIDDMDLAIGYVSSLRSSLGALQNRLESTVRNLDTIAENLAASESRIRDIDMAKEMANFTKWNILQQSSTAMLAQANQMPQTVLQLLR